METPTTILGQAEHVKKNKNKKKQRQDKHAYLKSKKKGENL